MSQLLLQNKSAQHSESVSNTVNSAFQTCGDTSDAVELFVPQQLYLKPVAKLNISVQLPQLKLPGKTISNWEVMEKLKTMVKPVQFTVLKVSKSTLEFIRFEGEIENKANLNEVVARLDGRTIKLSGFSELLKIRSAEAKTAFPTRHTWDSYFRDAKNMNEMKPGERPDTIHLSNLPSRWFSSRQENGRGNDKPSEYVFRKVFEQFGEIRSVDIPMLDPYRSQMKAHISGMKTFSFGQELAFEGYVQYQEYVCFVKAMDALRGMKLLHKEGDKAYTASVKIDFDRTKHLSEASIRKRRIERERLMAKEREQEEHERRAKEDAEVEAEKLRKQEEEQEQLKAQVAEEKRQRKAERHQARQLRRLKREEAQRMNYKIAVEERKLLIAQRKLESIRLLDELFERVKVLRLQETRKEIACASKQTNQEKDEKEDMEKKERELRSKLMRKYKSMQELQLKGQQEKLRQTVEGRGKVQSALTPSQCKKDEEDVDSEDSSSSSSSGISVLSNMEISRRKKIEDEKRDGGVGNTETSNPWHTPIGATAPGLFPMDFHSGLMGFNPAFGGRFPYPQGPVPQEMFAGGGRGRWSRWPHYSGGPKHAAAGAGYMMQNYYYGMSDDYYKYFSKLAGQTSHSGSRSRSRSRSGSRSRTRHRRRSTSRSRRSRSRSRSKSGRSKSSRRSRSRTKIHSRRSRSNSRSKSTMLRTKGRSRSRSTSKSRKTESTVRSPNSSAKSHSRLSATSAPKNSIGRSRSSKSRSRSRQRSASPIESTSLPRKRGAIDIGKEVKGPSALKMSSVIQKQTAENGLTTVGSIKTKKKKRRK